MKGNNLDSNNQSSFMVHLNLSSMRSKEKYSKLIFPIVRRYISSNQQTVTPRASARSFFVRFIEDRRKKTQQDDIRLQPYASKGVFSESGAIRPIPKRYPLGIVKVLLTAISFLYLGSLVSKYAALALERMDLFVYSADDDDDDDD